MRTPGSRGPAEPRFASPQSYTPKHLAEKILTSKSALEGEWKQVTVLFCDIVGSTALAERLGAEAMHGLLDQFFELALAEVHRYEGTINQFLGDGFMALFGAPVAHEDHAQRGVLAALAIRRVPIVGEPGMGKSRLLYEFRQSLAGGKVTYLEGRTTGRDIRPPGSTSPMRPR